jgi:hypothetical protein
MLTAPPPPALRRLGGAGPIGQFDLLVIDEAPWFSLLGERKDVSIEWFDPSWWRDREVGGNADDRNNALDTLGTLHSILSHCPPGEISAAPFRQAGLSARSVTLARRLVWRYKVELRDLVRPGSNENELARALSAAASIIPIEPRSTLTPLEQG